MRAINLDLRGRSAFNVFTPPEQRTHFLLVLQRCLTHTLCTSPPPSPHLSFSRYVSLCYLFFPPVSSTPLDVLCFKMQQVDNTNVFVKYLPADVDDSRLRSLFSPFGSIVSAKVMVEVHTGTSLGYGYVFWLFILFTHEKIAGEKEKRQEKEMENRNTTNNNYFVNNKNTIIHNTTNITRLHFLRSYNPH